VLSAGRMEFEETVDWGEPVDSGGVIDCADGVTSGDVFADDGSTDGVEDEAVFMDDAASDRAGVDEIDSS
jgi:hypothetical protein